MILQALRVTTTVPTLRAGWEYKGNPLRRCLDREGNFVRLENKKRRTVNRFSCLNLEKALRQKRGKKPIYCGITTALFLGNPRENQTVS